MPRNVPPATRIMTVAPRGSAADRDHANPVTAPVAVASQSVAWLRRLVGNGRTVAAGADIHRSRP
jgi:hypothetical protein